MPKNPFSHIDLRVRDFAEAVAFYKSFLPLLGLERFHDGDAWKSFAAAGELPEMPWFGFAVDAAHRPNANRIAFWVESRTKVDEVGRAVIEAGAGQVEGPALWEEEGPNYYAVFFEDPSGNRLEVLHRTR